MTRPAPTYLWHLAKFNEIMSAVFSHFWRRCRLRDMDKFERSPVWDLHSWIFYSMDEKLLGQMIGIMVQRRSTWRRHEEKRVCTTQGFHWVRKQLSFLQLSHRASILFWLYYHSQDSRIVKWVLRRAGDVNWAHEPILDPVDTPTHEALNFKKYKKNLSLKLELEAWGPTENLRNECQEAWWFLLKHFQSPLKWPLGVSHVPLVLILPLLLLTFASGSWKLGLKRS